MDTVGGRCGVEVVSLTQTAQNDGLFGYGIIALIGISVILLGYTLIHFVVSNKRNHVLELRRSDDSEFIRVSYRIILKIMTAFDSITMISMFMFITILGLWVLLMVINS